MASKEERDARLDELSTATQQWAAKKRARLQAQVTFGKRLLKGRTGSERLNDKSVQTASNLLVEEIGQFLSGE